MRKLYTHLLSFPLLLVDPATFCPSYKNGIKTYNFRIKSGMCKRSINRCNTTNYFL